MKTKLILLTLATIPITCFATPQQEIMVAQYERQIDNANRTITFFGLQLEELLAAQNNYLLTGGTLNSEDLRVAWKLKSFCKRKKKLSSACKRKLGV